MAVAVNAAVTLPSSKTSSSPSIRFSSIAPERIAFSKGVGYLKNGLVTGGKAASIRAQVATETPTK
ncbi:hypothetical protein CRG98_040475, partial [Punica granatum]